MLANVADFLLGQWLGKITGGCISFQVRVSEQILI